MAIVEPGKRMGKRFEHSKVLAHGTKKANIIADLNVTPMVDMFVILVCFLIANFSATGEILSMNKDIKLPEASNRQDIQLAPVVLVSQASVAFDGKDMGRVEDLVRADYLNIPQLEEMLRDRRKSTEDLHAAAGDGSGFKGDINIQADHKVTFNIIKRVMFSCASAGYGNISFAVMPASSGAAPGTETASR